MRPLIHFVLSGFRPDAPNGTQVPKKVFAAGWAIAGILCALAPSALWGQFDSPTLPELAPGEPASSYALGSIDSVNYYNGLLNVHVPLKTVGARGTFSKTLVTPIQRQWLATGNFTTGYPYSDTVPNTLAGYGYVLGYLSVESSSQYAYTCPIGPYYEYWTTPGKVLTWLVWHAPDLTETVLTDTSIYGGQAEPVATDCNTFYTGADRGRVFRGSDGSGMVFVASRDVIDGPPGNSYGLGGTLYFKDGTRYSLNIDGSATQAEDQNGNVSTWAFTSTFAGGEYTVADSAGRSASFNFTEDLNTLDYDTIQWAGTGGAARTITVNYAPFDGSTGVNPLGAGVSPQPENCLFSDMSGATSTVFDPWVVSSIVLPDQTSYTFTYDVYGEVAKILLPTGGAYTYTYSGTVCAMNAHGIGLVAGGSGAQNVGMPNVSIYRRVLERDEYAKDATTITAKTLFSAAANTPATGQTRVTVTFEDGLGNVLKTETHDFQGDPTAAASIPTDPTEYPGWNDGLEFESTITDPTYGTLETRQVAIGQRPCDLSIDSPSCILQGNSDVPSAYPPRDAQTCQINGTLGALGSGPTSWVTFGYDKYNNQTDMREFDFGSAPAAGFVTSCPAPASGYLRDTATTYNTSSTYTTTPTGGVQPYLVSLPITRIVSGASGTAAEDQWAYDQTATSGASGEPGHDDTNYPASYNIRGNATTHTVNNTSSSTASEAFGYDQTGNLHTHQDFNSNVTTLNYTDSTHVNPNTVVSALDAANGWSTAYVYDQNTLQPTSVEDENSNFTYYTYESAANTLDRLTEVERGETIHSYTSYVYPASPNPPTSVIVKQDQVNPGDGAIQTETDYDLLGRPITTKQYESAGYIATTQTWDALGRISQTTAPSRSGDGLNFPTTYTYDALGRPVNVLTVDGSQTVASYSGATATVTDPAGAARRNTIDGLGRLKEVEEDPSGNDYVTQYAYNALDDITTVTQGAQTRSFAWNMRGWQMSATNPEQSAATSYTYDNNGNVIYREDARGIETCYQYDSVNRLTLQVYYTGSASGACSGITNNTSSPTTPNVQYNYDTSGISNARGRLVSVTNGNATDSIAGYDELGRILGNSQTIGSFSPAAVYYSYDKADEIYQTIYPTGRTVNTSFDVAGRTTGVTGVLGGTSKPYATATCTGSSCNPYAPDGAPNGLTYGNGLTRAFTYNNRLQPATMTDTLSASTLFSLGYTFGTATTNNGNPTQVAIGGTGGSFTQTYGYDHLNRVSGFADTGGGGVSQTLMHDQYGNMWQSAQTGLSSVEALAAMPTSSSGINAANNQVTGGGNTFDGTAGNQTTFMGVQMYYDAENRLVEAYNTVSGNTYVYGYDGLGERVTKALSGGTTTYYVHDASGNTVAEYNSQTALACATCYLSQDHLGSTRMVTDSGGNIVARHDYLPFGVEIPSGVAGRGSSWSVTDGLSPKFTGQDRDTETQLDYFYARYYASGLGRFTSVDPGNAGADVTDPQTWNMYGYVRNSPLTLVDPSGLDDCDDTDADDGSCGVDEGDWPGWGGPGWQNPWGGGGLPAAVAVPFGGTPVWPGTGVANGLTGTPTVGPSGLTPAQQTQADAATAYWLGVVLQLAGPGPHFLGANAFIYVMERTGGPWDFKNQPHPGAHPELDDFGNCHYGVVGQAVGLPDGWTRWAAGVASYLHFRSKGKTPPPTYGRPWSGPPWGDNPQNQAQIRLGQQTGACK